MSPETKKLLIGFAVAIVFVLIMYHLGAVEKMSGYFDPFYSRLFANSYGVSAGALGREARGRLCDGGGGTDQFMFNGKKIGCEKCLSPGWCPECLDSDYDWSPREKMGAVTSQMKSRSRTAMIVASEAWDGVGAEIFGRTNVSCPRSGISDARLMPEIRQKNTYGDLYASMGFDVDAEGAVVLMENQVSRLPADPPVFVGQNGYMYKEM